MITTSLQCSRCRWVSYAYVSWFFFSNIFDLTIPCVQTFTIVIKLNILFLKFSINGKHCIGFHHRWTWQVRCTITKEIFTSVTSILLYLSLTLLYFYKTVTYYILSFTKIQLQGYIRLSYILIEPCSLHALWSFKNIKPTAVNKTNRSPPLSCHNYECM